MTYKQMHDQVMQWLGLQEITSYDESQLASDLLFQGTLDLLSRTRCAVRCVQLADSEAEFTADQIVRVCV